MNKYDIEIVLKNDKLAKFDIFGLLSITVDYDYIEDVEDVYAEIENYIWETYGVSLSYKEDFEITDDGQEVIDEMFAAH